MGYSMRLELTRVCSLNGFQLVMGLYGGHSSLFLWVFILVCFTSHLPLISDTFFFFVVCVCVYVWVFSDFTYSYFFSMGVWMCVLRFCVCVCVCVCVFVFVCGSVVWNISKKVNLATLLEVNTKAPFSIVTTPRCRGGCYSFCGLLNFTLDPYLIILSVKKAASSTIFWVFGMTRPGIESWSPGPLVNTLLIRPMAGNYFLLIICVCVYINIYTYLCMFASILCVCVCVCVCVWFGLDSSINFLSFIWSSV